MYESSVLDIHELDAATRSRWDELLRASAVPTAFLSQAYAAATDKAFGGVKVCIFRQHGKPIAFFAFNSTRMLRAGNPVGRSFSDYVGLVAKPDFRISPAELLEACGLNTLLFTHLDESQQGFGLTGTKPSKGLRIRATNAAEFLTELAQRDKKFFQDTERRIKKLERDKGPLRFAFESADSATLDWLINTKIEQYRRTGRKKYPFDNPQDRAFLRALATQDDVLCRPRLTALYCADKLIAAHFGLQCAGTLAYWFPVYDTAFHSYSPGRLLLWETLKHANEVGINCVDRGEGDTQAKRDFANEEHVFLRDYYARKTLAAFVDKGINSVRWRMEAWRKERAD